MRCSGCHKVLDSGAMVCPSCLTPHQGTMVVLNTVNSGTLVALNSAKSGTMVATGDETLTIGRDSGCEIVLQMPVVSSRHAEIRVLAGMLQIRDIRSTNGTYVAGARITDWTILDTGAELRFGSYRVPVNTIEGWRDRLSGRVADTKAVRVDTGSVVTVGRDPASTVCIDHPTVSWNHARVEREGDALYITDLKSTNGTFVNGERVKRARVEAGAQVRVGTVPLDIGSGVVQASRTYRGEVRIDVRGITRQIAGGRVILDDVSLSVFPGEMVALMGPSGAGKTTLLEVLTGQRVPSSGSVLINDVDLHAHRSSLAPMIGYVPQEDVMHRDLTVFEVLYHSALLRLPTDLPDTAIRAHVDSLIERMGLAHVRDTLIGGESVRGVSGGQRKRVNIAIELITEPPLLFLDEPTSGLDATATLEVLTLLQGLAKDGRTILMTVHQPRVEAFRLMDMLLLLEKGGKLAYFGPALPGAADYFERHAGPMPKGANPADYVLDVLESKKTLGNGEECPPGTWQRLYRGSETHASYVRSRLVDRQSVEIAAVGDGSSSRGAPGMGRQLRSLVTRLVRRKSRDRAALVLQILQPLVVGGLLAAVFDGMERWPFVVTGTSGEDPCVMPVVLQAQAAVKVHAVLFLVGATAFWLGCSNVARELVAERAVFRRERMAGLSVPAYATSVFGVQALAGAVQCLVLAGLIWGANLSLESSFAVGFGATFLTLLSGLSVGMVVSSLVRTEVTAISTLPLLLLPQLILAGFIEPYARLSDGFRALSALMPVRWAFDGILRLEYLAATPVCGVERVFGFPDLPASPLWVLGGFSIVALIVTYARLRAITTSSDT